MGKKKTSANANKPDDHKDLGNNKFNVGKFQEAIDHYTNAIEMSKENPNHIYFANRANAKLQLKQYSECIQDCDQAIKIDSKFIKSYVRKARAQQFATQFTQALETANLGLGIEAAHVELLEIQSQVNIEIQHALPQGNAERKKFDNFNQWLVNGGSEISKLRQRAGNSVHAATNIKTGDVIAQFTMKNIISQAQFFETTIGQLLTAAGYTAQNPFKYDAYAQVICSLFFLNEMYSKKNDAAYVSPYQAYLDLQPDLNNPILYTQDELKWLEGSQMVDSIKSQNTFIGSVYLDICKRVPEFKKYAFDDFKYCFVRTHKMFVTNMGGVVGNYLVPGIEFLNHQNPAVSDWRFNNSTGCLELQATQNIAFGEPVTLSFGNHSSMLFFMAYGYSESPHRNDTAALTLALLPEDQDAKFHLKSKYVPADKYKQTFTLSSDMSQPWFLNLMQFTRFRHYQEEDAAPIVTAVVDIQSRNGVFVGRLPAEDLALELVAWKAIRDEAQAHVDKFPTTLEQDTALIAKDDAEHNLTFSQRNCVKFRMGEKVIYQNLIFFADAAARFGTMAANDVKTEVSTWEGERRSALEYFRDEFCALLAAPAK